MPTMVSTYSKLKPYSANASDVPRSLQSWVSTIQRVVLTADVFQLFCVPRSLQSWVSTIQTVVLTADVFQLLKIKSWKTSAVSTTVKKLKNVSCEYNRLNGWNSTFFVFYKKLKNVSCEYDRPCVTEWLKLNFASCVVHQAGMFIRIIWFLWTKRTIWLLILSFTQNIVRACYVLSLWRI